MYSEKVMDHFQHPRNVGEIENASGVGTVGNAKCGDIMRIFLDIDDETHIIKDCKFKTFGCGAAVATSSMATEMVKGKSIQEAMEEALLSGKSAEPIEVSFQYDLPSFFNDFDFINASRFAQYAGINESKMRQYKSGAAYPGEKTVKKILDAIHSIGADLSSVSL